MQCQDALSMLSAYLDGALDSAEQEAMRIHLTRCPACSAELEELRYSMKLLKELPELTPPAEFRTQLMEKLNQLNAAQKATQDSSWFSRVNGMARSNWYRAATVAAVMVMTLGLSALWDREGKPILPVDPKHNDVIIAVQEPQGQNSNAGDSSGNGVDTPIDQNPTVTPGIEPTKPVETPSAPAQPGSSQPAGETPTQPETPKPVIRQVENFTPQPSDGLAASSATLKLDVQELEPTLKAIGKTVQDYHGSIYTDFSGSEEAGTMSIKVSRKSFVNVIGALQQLGTVVTYLPT